MIHRGDVLILVLTTEQKLQRLGSVLISGGNPCHGCERVDVSSHALKPNIPLPDSAALLQAISDNTGDVIFAKDRAGRMTFANPATLAIIGKPLEEVLGRTDIEVLADAEAARKVMANDVRIMASGQAEDVEEVVPLPDGTPRVWFSRKIPYRNERGEVIGLLGVSRDITARKQVEEQARRTREQLEQVMNSIHDGLLVMDRAWRYTYFSERAAQIMGVKREDMMGRVVWDLFPDARRTKFFEFYHKAVQTQQPQHFEERFPGPHDQWLECHCYPTAEGLTVYFHDVSARRKAEEAAADARRRLGAAVIANEIGTFEWDVVKQRAWGDANFARMFGVKLDQDGAASVDDYLAAIHPDDRPRARDAMVRTIATGADYDTEYRVIGTGQPRWLLVRAKPERDEQGRVRRCLGVVLDITDRRDAEAALRATENRHHSVLENMSEGLLLFDAEMNLIYQNAASLRIHGFDPRDPGHMTNNEVPATWLAWELDGRPVSFDGWPVSRVFRGERFQDQIMRVVHAETNYEFYGSYNGSPIYAPDGKIVLGFITVRDITAQVRATEEKRRAEDKVRESEERFRALADNISQLAWMTDETGYIVWYNQRWYDYTGTTFEQMKGWGWQAVHHPDHLQRVIERYRQSLDTGEVWEDTFPLRGKDGSYRWFLSRAVPIRDAAGKVLHWFGTNTDITEQREAKERAEAASQAKDQLLAMVSHELRTPLNPILAITSYLQESDTLPPALREDIDIIRRNIEHEARIVDDLLNVTRLSRGKVALQRETVDMHALIRTVVGQFQPQMTAKGISLLVSLQARPHHVWADPGRMQQVLSNLFDNAMKFTPAGGMVTVRTTIAQGRVCVAVVDTGVGIDPEVLPRLFTPFEQGEKTITRRFGGLGLGLVIIKGIMELHGGSVRVHSDGRGLGSTFVLELDPVPGVVRENPPVDKEVPPSNACQRILLVEDHPDTLRTMRRLLCALGYSVVSAGNVAEAMRMVDAEEFDVLVSDIGLPDGSGLDIMRAVKDRRGKKGIALSGFGHDEDIRRSTQAGFAEHIVKPVNIQYLDAALRRLQC